MICRIAILAAFALAASGCATYDDAYNQGYRTGGTYYAAANGYGDYYYDRPEVVFNDYGPGGYGGYGYGFGYDPWFYNQWYCCRDRDDWDGHDRDHDHDHGRDHDHDHDGDDWRRHGAWQRGVAYRPGPDRHGHAPAAGRVDTRREPHQQRQHN